MHLEILVEEQSMEETLKILLPRLLPPDTLSTSRKFRDPDSIPGGTWETLERILKRQGYFKGGYLKVEGARTIAAQMDPDRNRSRSFQVFRDGLLAMT